MSCDDGSCPGTAKIKVAQPAVEERVTVTTIDFHAVVGPPLGSVASAHTPPLAKLLSGPGLLEGMFGRHRPRAPVPEWHFIRTGQRAAATAPREVGAEAPVVRRATAKNFGNNQEGRDGA